MHTSIPSLAQPYTLRISHVSTLLMLIQHGWLNSVELSRTRGVTATLDFFQQFSSAFFGYIYSFVFRQEGTTQSGRGVSAYVVMWPPHAHWAYGRRNNYTRAHVFTHPVGLIFESLMACCAVCELLHRDWHFCSSFCHNSAGLFSF